jgi:transposase
MTYSLDFRKKVMQIKESQSLTFQAASDRFGIGIRTLFRWANKIEPETTRNKPATKINMEKLAEDVKKHPDAFLYERAERFGVSKWGIGLALRRLGISYKKNSVSSKSEQR